MIKIFAAAMEFPDTCESKHNPKKLFLLVHPGLAHFPESIQIYRKNSQPQCPI